MRIDDRVEIPALDSPGKRQWRCCDATTGLGKG